MPTTDSGRYLAFVDYLGTRALYAGGSAEFERIVDNRMEIEHAIQARLQPLIAAQSIEIGVFSDTVLIAGAAMSDVIDAATQLITFVFEKTLRRNDPDDIRQLRGGLSFGKELRSGRLRPGSNVSVIPFFDTSLAFAYELEGIRRGGRLFIAPNIAQKEQGDLTRFMFRWQSMTGFGPAAINTSEFLWPAYVHRNVPEKLIPTLAAALKLWDGASTQVRDADHYHATLYHFDETIKLIIRSFAVFMDEYPALLDALSLLLPNEQTSEAKRVRYLWGIWFQIALVICGSERKREFITPLSALEAVLRRHNYWDKFVAETDYIDYQPMKWFVDQQM